MSFFGDLLVGVAGGAASGRLLDIDAQEKERAAEKKAAYAAALQEQKDAAAEERMNIRMGGGTGGKSGGKDGLHLFERVLNAKTPEEQAALVRAVEAFGGKSGAANLSETAFGKPITQERSYETVDALGDGSYGGTTSVSERVAYDRERGIQSLQRLQALLVDPGKVDDFAKGERQFGLNDNATAVEQKVLKRGGTLEEGAAAFQKYSGTTDDTQKNQLAADRIAATNRRTDVTSAAGSEKLTAAQVKDAERTALEYRKLAADIRSNKDPQKAKYLQKAQDIEDALTAARTMTPAASSTTTVAPVSGNRLGAGDVKALADRFKSGAYQR